MEETTKPKISLARRAWSFVQWCVTALLLLIVLLMASGNDALNAPGAPVASYYAAVGIIALVAALLSPPIFFRLPAIAKVGSYLGILASFVFAGEIIGQVQSAYEATPEGARVAAERETVRRAAEEADRRDAQRDLERAAQQAEADADAALEREVAANMAEDEAKLADCLSFFAGDVTDLTERVKERLHNPDSFEHVETTFFGVTGANTFMTFRAENGFGAIRSNSVSARVDPDTCKVTSLGEFSAM